MLLSLARTATGRLFLFAGLAAFVQSLAGAAPAHVPSVPGERLIAYCYQGQPNPEIHLLRADGTGAERIFRAAGGLNHPDWSPDGTRIAVAGIRTMNQDGTNLHQLTSPSGAFDAEPQWSPDGTQIAFTRVFYGENAPRELWLMNADGSNPHSLGIQLVDAAEWSPDGARLIYASGGLGHNELFTCRADGSDVRQLTSLQSDSLQACWMPDGNSIVFNTVQEETNGIYLMNNDGSGIRPLMQTTAGIWKAMPSPDGSQITFGSCPPESPDHWEIYLMDANGANVRRLTHSPANVTSVDPDWRPVIGAPYLGQTGPGPVPVAFAPTRLPPGANAITFTPDGRECFFTLWQTDKNTLWTTQDINGTWPNPQLAPFSGNYWDMEAHITPDGNRLLFGSKRPLSGGSAGELYGWWCEGNDLAWSNPLPLDPPLRNVPMMFPSAAANGNLYFTSGTNGFETQWIAMARLVDGAYLPPEPLGGAINGVGTRPAHPFIAPDESYLLFDAVTQDPYLTDLFISFRLPAGGWSRSLGLSEQINAPLGREGLPFVSRDGKYLFLWKDERLMWMNAQFISQMRASFLNLGDLNQSGGVEAADLCLLGLHLTGGLTPGTFPFTAPRWSADVNWDGQVNAADLVVLAEYLAGSDWGLPK